MSSVGLSLLPTSSHITIHQTIRHNVIHPDVLYQSTYVTHIDLMLPYPLIPPVVIHLDAKEHLCILTAFNPDANLLFNLMSSTLIPTNHLFNLMSSSLIPTNHLFNLMSSTLIPTNHLFNLMSFSLIPTNHLFNLMSSSLIPTNHLFNLMSSAPVTFNGLLVLTVFNLR